MCFGYYCIYSYDLENINDCPALLFVIFPDAGCTSYYCLVCSAVLPGIKRVESVLTGAGATNARSPEKRCKETREQY